MSHERSLDFGGYRTLPRRDTSVFEIPNGEHEMALLIASIASEDAGEMRARAERALADGADAVELRLDALASAVESLVDWASAQAPGRVIATCRSAAEGGASSRPADERLAALAPFAANGVRIDFEWASTRSLPGFQTQVSAWHPPGASRGVARLILSSHAFDGGVSDPAALLQAISNQPNVIPKLAWMPADICDSIEALSLMRTARVPSIVICMGETGLMSRVLTPKVGGFATYCSTAGGATAPGQVDLATMLTQYRWASIDADTRVLGVIGWPVAHSLSPAIHNAALARADINAVYLPLAVRPDGSTLERFLDACLANEWLGALGFSVTAPHKTRVLNYLGTRVDERAQRIGAVNTVVVTEGGYFGYNTDYDGVLRALTRGLACPVDDLDGERVLVLGAGGAARAAVAALRDHGAEVAVCGRSADRSGRLAGDFNCRAVAWDERDRQAGAILINCTSVGMWPDTETSPLAEAAIGRYDVVFDAVYNPIHTRLLRTAAEAGCRVISGTDMFVEQAAEQFRLWTGQVPDRTLMQREVQEALSGGD